MPLVLTHECRQIATANLSAKQTGEAATECLPIGKYSFQRLARDFQQERGEVDRVNSLGEKSFHYWQIAGIHNSLPSIKLMRFCLIEAIIYHFGVESLSFFFVLHLIWP